MLGLLVPTAPLFLALTSPFEVDDVLGRVPFLSISCQNRINDAILTYFAMD